MVTQDSYRISLESFQGPLDLLLYLVRRAEVDIQDISIAAVTDQYLDVLRQVKSVDIEQAGEFLVMAATLVEIKSRMLMPPEKNAGDDGGDRPIDDPLDPRQELIQQLLAYQRYRIAAEDLDLRRVLFEQRYSARPAWKFFEGHDDEDADAELELEDVHVFDLSEAYERIASAIDFARLGSHHIEFDDTPIELYEQDLLDQLERTTQRQLTLQRAFQGQNQSQRIGLFLATLELTRVRRITVQQDDIDAEILITKRDPETDDAALAGSAIELSDEIPGDSPSRTGS